MQEGVRTTTKKALIFRWVTAKFLNPCAATFEFRSIKTHMMTHYARTVVKQQDLVQSCFVNVVLLSSDFLWACGRYHRHEEIHCPPSSAPKRESVCSLQTLVSAYKSTRHHDSEQHGHIYRSEKFISHTVPFCL